MSQPLVIKDARAQIGVAGEGRSDLTVYGLKCVPVTGKERGGAQVAGRRGDVENEESRMLVCCSARTSGKAPFSSNHVS